MFTSVPKYMSEVLKGSGIEPDPFKHSSSDAIMGDLIAHDALV